MATHLGAAAYDPVVPAHKFVVGRPDRRSQGDKKDAARPEPSASAIRPADVAAVEQMLQLLGRAVRQFHTYPATSPLCADAVAACAKVLAALGRDQVVLRVVLQDLLLDEFAIGRGTVIEHELVRRLHRAGVAAVTIDRSASARDLSRFCSDLISLQEVDRARATLAELLTEHGVDKIVVRMSYRPEVFDLGSPQAPLRDLVERERSRRETMVATGPAAHLYPPDKGWVRLDPTSTFATISLVDLAILVNDPAEFAGVLLRLTDGEPAGGPATHQTALELKFSDVATVFASLDPRLAQLMFARLARAVLELEPGQRQSLLQRTILPGALDGRADGRVLAEFPDVDLAEALCLLLDLETAAPEVLPAALDRMNLPAERRQTLAPLLDAGVRERMRTGRLRDRDEPSDVDRYARKLLQVDRTAPGSFAEFAAFDLSVDGETSDALSQVRAGIQSADALVARMRCLSNLVRLEPNPTAVEAFLRGVSDVLGELERTSRWQDVASWLTCHRQLAESLSQSRPDVAEAIAAALQAFCTRERAARVVEFYDQGGEHRALASTLVNALGGAAVPAFIALLDEPAAAARTRSLVALMCAHARQIAPALAARANQAGPAAAAVAVKVLGFAGPGHEAAIAREFERGSEQTTREALRALARIGTTQAAVLVSKQVRNANARVRGAAQEALCRFPASRAQMQLVELLGRRDFVLRHPDTAGRLLDRAVQADPAGLKPTLAALVPLRFRFWNPALARLGMKARDVLKGRGRM